MSAKEKSNEKSSVKIKVKLVKSLIGRPETQRKVVKALGLYKTNQVVEHFDSPIIRGMLHQVKHLILVEAA
jgi:large subunit ribosomal protein L30